MSRETKEQRLADAKRGRVENALRDAYVAMYQLGFRHGKEEVRREERDAKNKHVEELSRRLEELGY